VKLSYSQRFPHPVLTPYTGDFVGQEISFTCDDIEEVVSTNELAISYSISISDPSLRNLISQGTVGIYISIVCLETFYNQFHEVETSGRVIVQGGLLHGRTRIRPILAVKSPIPSFSSENLHEEFQPYDFSFVPGDVIGFGEEILVSIGHEKLAPMESIFRLSKSEDLPEGGLGIDMEKPFIDIKLSPGLYQSVQSLRNTARFLPVVLNAIYAPVIMHVIATLGAGDQEFEGMRWYRVFRAKCEHVGVNLENADALDATQILLDWPLKELSRFVEASLNES